VRQVHQHIALGAEVLPQTPEQLPVTVTVVGDRIFGSVDRVLATQARCLADVAGVDLLAVHFSGNESNAEFLGADLLPDTGESFAPTCSWHRFTMYTVRGVVLL